MALSQLIDWGNNFYSQYPLFCYIAGGILLLLTLWKPFKVLKTAVLLLILLLVIYAAFYLLDSMSIGRQVKDDAVHRTEKALQ